MTMKLEEVASFVEKSEDEMLKDTYNRLRIELVQLHERIDSESQKKNDLKPQQLDDIPNYLSALKGVISDKKEDVNLTNPTAQRLAALENRIKELEWTLGIDAGQTTTSSLFPLLKKLEELKLRVTILTPELIGRINKRLQESSREINSARSDASHDSLSMIREDKSSGLGEMHELIKRWDARCSELPNIVSHLVASRQLHEDAGRVCRKYAQFTALKNEVDRSLNFLQKFDELNSKQNAERLDSIRQRIKAVKK